MYKKIDCGVGSGVEIIISFPDIFAFGGRGSGQIVSRNIENGGLGRSLK